MDSLSAGRQGMLDLLAEGASLEQTLSHLCVLVEQEAPGSLCSILILEGGRLRHGAAPHLPESYWRPVDGLVIGPEAGSCGSAAYFGQEVAVEDIRADPRWAAGRELALAHGLAACVSTPILEPGGQVLGTFALYHTRPGPFPEPELSLLRSMMGLASLAIRIHGQEVRLKDSESRLRAILDALPDMYVRVRLDGTILDFRAGAFPSTLDGWQAVGSRIQDAPIPPELRSAIFDTAEQALHTEELSSLEFHLPLSDGEHFRELRIIRTRSDEVLAIVRDITDRKRSEAALSRRLDAETLIASLSTEFISLPPDRTDEAIHGALASIGRFADVDRIYIFQVFGDGSRFSNTHEWCAEGIEPQMDNLQDLPTRLFSWSMARLRRFEEVIVPRVAELPGEARAEKRILLEQGIRSLVLVPMGIGGRYAGFLGFDAVREERIWQAEDVRILRLAAEIFAGALERQRMNAELTASEQRYRDLVERQGEGFIIVDASERVTFANPAGETIFGVPRGGLLGRSLEEFLTPRGVQQSGAADRTALRGPERLLRTSDRPARWGGP